MENIHNQISSAGKLCFYGNLLSLDNGTIIPQIFYLSIVFVKFFKKILFIVIYCVFCKLDKPLAQPFGLDYFNVCTRGNKYSQKQLYALKFASVILLRKILCYQRSEFKHRRSVWDVQNCGVGELKLQHSSLRLCYFNFTHRAYNVVQIRVVLKLTHIGKRKFLGIIISAFCVRIYYRGFELRFQLVNVTLRLSS